MIPVTQLEVESRLRRVLTTAETQWFAGVAEEASVLIEGYLAVRYGVDDVVPEAVTVVASRVTARILTTINPPPQTESMTRGMGPFSATQQFVPDSTSGGPWLTKPDKVSLEPYRVGGVACIPLTREGYVFGGS